MSIPMLLRALLPKARIPGAAARLRGTPASDADCILNICPLGPSSHERRAGPGTGREDEGGGTY